MVEVDATLFENLDDLDLDEDDQDRSFIYADDD